MDKVDDSDDVLQQLRHDVAAMYGLLESITHRLSKLQEHPARRASLVPAPPRDPGGVTGPTGPRGRMEATSPGGVTGPTGPWRMAEPEEPDGPYGPTGPLGLLEVIDDGGVTGPTGPWRTAPAPAPHGTGGPTGPTSPPIRPITLRLPSGESIQLAQGSRWMWISGVLVVHP